MKKTKVGEMRAEYSRNDFGKGVRGKYLKSYQEGTNLVLLNPDVARAFPNDEAVNDALRSLMDISRRTGKIAKRAGKIAR
jgi:hypothetical protein